MGKSTPRRDITDLTRSFERALRARGRSPYTIRNYLTTLKALSAWLTERDLPAGATTATAEDITDWLLDVADTSSRHNALHHYRNLRSFWSWAVKERMLTAGEDPMLEVTRPHPEDVRRPPLSQEQVSALLKTCGRTGYRETRDAAIIRILADTGMRLSGLLGLRWSPDHPGLDNQGHSDVFLDHDPPLLRLRLKGGKQHFVDVAPRTATAIDRYLRYRSSHRLADDPALFLGHKPLTRGGLQAMLDRRATEAGIAESIHPHRFRRSMATWHLDAGGSRDSLMARAGWSSDEMIRLYVSESRDRLAWAESQRLGIANRF